MILEQTQKCLAKLATFYKNLVLRLQNKSRGEKEREGEGEEKKERMTNKPCYGRRKLNICQGVNSSVVS